MIELNKHMSLKIMHLLKPDKINFVPRESFNEKYNLNIGVIVFNMIISSIQSKWEAALRSNEVVHFSY